MRNILRNNNLIKRILRGKNDFDNLFIVENNEDKNLEYNKWKNKEYSKHYHKLPIYNFEPFYNEAFYVSPNSTIRGEFTKLDNSTIWNNTVIRGDINKINFGFNVHILENCALLTVSSVDNGLVSSLIINHNAIIQQKCTLVSCNIGDSALIGYNSVVLEGSIIEDESIIAPNSVVPPNRIIPSHQLWGGNPVKFIRNLEKKEIVALKFYNKKITELSKDYCLEFMDFNSAYLQVPNDIQEIFNQKKFKRESQ